MPAASVRTAASVNPGERQRLRMAESSRQTGLAQIPTIGYLNQSSLRVLWRMPFKGHRGGYGAAIVLAPRTGVPMYEQIYSTLRDAIVRGTLRAGARIAATRALARDLAVSRFTVVAA